MNFYINYSQKNTFWRRGFVSNLIRRTPISIVNISSWEEKGRGYRYFPWHWEIENKKRITITLIDRCSNIRIIVVCSRAQRKKVIPRYRNTRRGITSFRGNACSFRKSLSARAGSLRQESSSSRADNNLCITDSWSRYDCTKTGEKQRGEELEKRANEVNDVTRDSPLRPSWLDVPKRLAGPD